jgi:hypothetical protein
MEANDRFDAGVTRRPVESDRAIQRIRVGERERCHTVLARTIHKFVDPAPTLEKRIVAVTMEVNELHNVSVKIRLGGTCPLRFHAF